MQRALVNSQFITLYSDLNSVRSIFELITKDEENHREILATVEAFFTPEESVKDNTPIVRYQHPDAW